MQITPIRKNDNYNYLKNQNVFKPIFSYNAPYDTVSFSGNKIDTKEIDFANKFSSEDIKIIDEIATQAKKTNTNIYLIGGVVRDMILGREANDIDFIIEGDAVAFTKALAKENENVEIIYLKDEFGTSQIKINGKSIDLASTREESYIRKAMPTVRNIGCPMDKDVIRRDFSINSIALKIDKDENGNIIFNIIDKTNGACDLNSKILRVNYPKSFEDDPTRIIRGLRFRLKYGLKYDKKTQKLQEQYLKNPPVELISQTRVDTALRKLFADKNIAPKAFDMYIAEGIYKLSCDKTNAKSNWGKNIAKSSELFEIDDYVNLYMQALNNDKTTEILSLYNKNDKLTDFEIYNKMKKLSKEDLALYWAIVQDENALKYYNELKDVKPILDGKKLIDLGYKKGKQIGEILSLLMEEKLNCGKLNTIEDELEYISNFEFEMV